MPVNPTFDEKKVVSFFSILTILGLIMAVLCVLYRISALLPPFIVATIIAMTLVPEVDRMERRGYKRGVAIAVIYLLFLLSCGLILWGLNQVVSGHLATLVKNIIPGEIQKGTPKEMATLAAKLVKRYHVPAVFRSAVISQAQQVPAKLNTYLSYIPVWAENLVWLVIIPIIAFFILLDFYKILGKLLILAPRDRREDIMNAVTGIISVFGSYVRGVVLVMLLDMAVIFVVLMIAHLGPYALPLAIAAGLLYTIPYFGAFISTVSIGLITLAATHNSTTAALVTLTMIFIHQVVFDNIVAPRIIGKSVHMHPLLTLFALMCGGTLFGIGGTLLAVPIAAAIQIIMVTVFPALETDVVQVRRAARVARATIATDTEAASPASRKEGDLGELKQKESLARIEAQDPPPVIPPSPHHQETTQSDDNPQMS